jgi:hypothetical protein
VRHAAAFLADSLPQHRPLLRETDVDCQKTENIGVTAILGTLPLLAFYCSSAAGRRLACSVSLPGVGIRPQIAKKLPIPLDLCYNKSGILPVE